MKKVILTALVATALVAGVVAYASADTGNVAVTATVNPKFAMTIDKASTNFGGALDIGSSYNDTAVITVSSNRLWTFSKTSVLDATLTPVLTESTDVAAGANQPKGINTITATYALDLTTPAAYQLEAGTPYTSTFTYEAVQN